MVTKIASGNPDDNENSKKIRKVNLSDIQGELNKRGREAFHNQDLKDSLIELMNSENSDEAIVWEEGFVNPNLKEKQKTNLAAKFRNRVVSVTKQIAQETNKEFAVTIRYTVNGQMVISKRNA